MLPVWQAIPGQCWAQGWCYWLCIKNSGTLIIYIIIRMFLSANKQLQVLEDELDLQPSFSYIYLIEDDHPRQGKKSHLKTRSKVSKVRGVSTSRDRNTKQRSKIQNCLSRASDPKTTKTHEWSLPKSKKTVKPCSSKLAAKSKKEYKTIEPKSKESKLPNKKTEKSQRNNPSKRISIDSLFKKSEIGLKKKKGKEEALQKGQKDYKSQKSTNPLRKTRMGKSKSESAMDGITFSEIGRKEHRLGNKVEKVIHEYFGVEEKLSSIVERDECNKFKRTKTRIDKCKTQSSSRSDSQRKGSKLFLKSGKSKK